MWTRAASTSTYTPTSTITPLPSLTITNTITPKPTATFTASPQPIVAMSPMILYVRSVANVRTCPKTGCERVVQLNARDTVMATGQTNGEAVNGGSAVWYQVNRNGQQGFIWSGLVSTSLPTAVPPTRTPVPQPYIFPTSVPIYIAPYVPPSVPTSPIYGPYAGTGYEVVCADGEISTSGGKRGACSHHGGVR